MEMIRKPATRFAALASAASFALLFAAPAVFAERASDKDVKQLLERINNERDRFEDQLDGKIKGQHPSPSRRGSQRRASISTTFRTTSDKLKDRFTSDYAASAEVTTILRQGSDIQRFMSTQPPNFDGASEWNRLAGKSRRARHGLRRPTFPMPEGQQARRMNDAEVRKAADTHREECGSLQKRNSTPPSRTTPSIDVTTREAAVKDADGFKQDAERLASTIGDGKPASGEAQALLQHAGAIRGAAPGRPLSPAAQTAWGSVESELTKVAQAFNLPGWP